MKRTLRKMCIRDSHWPWWAWPWALLAWQGGAAAPDPHSALVGKRRSNARSGQFCCRSSPAASGVLVRTMDIAAALASTTLRSACNPNPPRRAAPCSCPRCSNHAGAPCQTRRAASLPPQVPASPPAAGIWSRAAARPGSNRSPAPTDEALQTVSQKISQPGSFRPRRTLDGRVEPKCSSDFSP